MAVVGFARISLFLSRNIRSIMTSSSKMEKVMEDLQTNPYYDKYAGKIAALQKTSPEEFLSRIEKKEQEIENARKRRVDKSMRQYSSLNNPKNITEGGAAPNKKLEDILKMELIVGQSSDEISKIWQTYHKGKDVIAAAIPRDIYTKLKKEQKKYPLFIFPLPRSQGYEFILSQTAGDSIHFTPLICYQVHKENAPECLTMVHYTELAEDKGIVLMRGDFDTNVINAQEAQCLANQFQLYYGQQYPSKTALLDTFNRKPDSFKHSDVLTELENLTIP